MKIVSRHFGLDGADPESMTEVAAGLGVSRVTAHSDLNAALATLRLAA
jgi:DNA-directed RNA polymerase sigma subunit (sigma70/sigma32)